MSLILGMFFITKLIILSCHSVVLLHTPRDCLTTHSAVSTSTVSTLRAYLSGYLRMGRVLNLKHMPAPLAPYLVPAEIAHVPETLLICPLHLGLSKRPPASVIWSSTEVIPARSVFLWPRSRRGTHGRKECYRAPHSLYLQTQRECRRSIRI